MFPVKWNKLQLAVEINFRFVLLLSGGKERENLNTESGKRVEAMKHQRSPRFAASCIRRRRREKFLPDSIRKRKIVPHHKHPVPDYINRHTQVFCAVEEKALSLDRERKVLRERKHFPNGGENGGGMESFHPMRKGKTRSSKSPAERKPKFLNFLFCLPCDWITRFHRKKLSTKEMTIN